MYNTVINLTESVPSPLSRNQCIEHLFFINIVQRTTVFKYNYIPNLRVVHNLDKNSQAVKKGAALFKMASIKKSCEIQAGGQEMAVMVG